MKEINSPTELVMYLHNVVDESAPHNTYVIGFTEGFFKTECNYIAKVNSEESLFAELEKLTHNNGHSHQFVIVRGSTVVESEDMEITNNFAEWIEDNKNNELLLDSLIVDWEKETFYSFICTDNEGCCGPNNQKSFSTKVSV